MKLYIVTYDYPNNSDYMIIGSYSTLEKAKMGVLKAVEKWNETISNTFDDDPDGDCTYYLEDGGQYNINPSEVDDEADEATESAEEACTDESTIPESEAKRIVDVVNFAVAWMTIRGGNLNPNDAELAAKSLAICCDYADFRGLEEVEMGA